MRNICIYCILMFWIVKCITKTENLLSMTSWFIHVIQLLTINTNVNSHFLCSSKQGNILSLSIQSNMYIHMGMHAGIPWEHQQHTPVWRFASLHHLLQESDLPALDGHLLQPHLPSPANNIDCYIGMSITSHLLVYVCYCQIYIHTNDQLYQRFSTDS